MDLFFEVLHGKTHIMCNAKDTHTPRELKNIIQGILKVRPETQALKKPTNESRTEWADLSDTTTLAELGFDAKNARADEPAILALVLPEDNCVVNYVKTSSPPPLPSAMTHEHANDS